MTTPRSFSSAVGPVMTRYLALKQALGRRYANERAVLQSLDSLLAGDGGPRSDLTLVTFTRWTQTLGRLTPTVRRNHLRIVRNFCLYRRRTTPTGFVPDPALFPPPHPPRRPYIFTEGEIARLLRATRTLARTPGSPLRPDVFRLALVLLYTTGLRRGELLRLTIGDYDPRDRTVLVRESKFHKSRVLPLSPDAVRELEAYLRTRRRRHLPVSPELPLLWNGYGGGRTYSGHGLGQGFRGLLAAARIRPPDGRLPRIHDVRHSFAVHALLRWYRAGDDPQAKLPLLATYMGHVSIASTHYYLPFVEPLGTAANLRFATRYGTLLGPGPARPGGES